MTQSLTSVLSCWTDWLWWTSEMRNAKETLLNSKHNITSKEVSPQLNSVCYFFILHWTFYGEQTFMYVSNGDYNRHLHHYFFIVVWPLPKWGSPNWIWMSHSLHVQYTYAYHVPLMHNYSGTSLWRTLWIRDTPLMRTLSVVPTTSSCVQIYLWTRDTSLYRTASWVISVSSMERLISLHTNGLATLEIGTSVHAHCAGLVCSSSKVGCRRFLPIMNPNTWAMTNSSTCQSTFR